MLKMKFSMMFMAHVITELKGYSQGFTKRRSLNYIIAMMYLIIWNTY